MFVSGVFESVRVLFYFNLKNFFFLTFIYICADMYTEDGMDCVNTEQSKCDENNVKTNNFMRFIYMVNYCHLFGLPILHISIYLKRKIKYALQ